MHQITFFLFSLCLAVTLARQPIRTFRLNSKTHGNLKSKFNLDVDPSDVSSEETTDNQNGEESVDVVTEEEVEETEETEGEESEQTEEEEESEETEDQEYSTEIIESSEETLSSVENSEGAI